ncbi:hypothetical protein NDU88_011082 [Pleurodeles waltl]|uniref:Uncharacterized protein n=1 Tax=Pleurodeles waltl TaxID=8319 RepID=A0AAV7S326_PLEWA|nr:hypothetical protein NDU88_011082 [Pleurodeles waltl]
MATCIMTRSPSARHKTMTGVTYVSFFRTQPSNLLVRIDDSNVVTVGEVSVTTGFEFAGDHLDIVIVGSVISVVDILVCLVGVNVDAVEAVADRVVASLDGGINGVCVVPSFIVTILVGGCALAMVDMEVNGAVMAAVIKVVGNVADCVVATVCTAVVKFPDIMSSCVDVVGINEAMIKALRSVGNVVLCDTAAVVRLCCVVGVDTVGNDALVGITVASWDDVIDVTLGVFAIVIIVVAVACVSCNVVIIDATVLDCVVDISIVSAGIDDDCGIMLIASVVCEPVTSAAVIGVVVNDVVFSGNMIVGAVAISLTANVVMAVCEFVGVILSSVFMADVDVALTNLSIFVCGVVSGKISALFAYCLVANDMVDNVAVDTESDVDITSSIFVTGVTVAVGGFVVYSVGIIAVIFAGDDIAVFECVVRASVSPVDDFNDIDVLSVGIEDFWVVMFTAFIMDEIVAGSAFEGVDSLFKDDMLPVIVVGSVVSEISVPFVIGVVDVTWVGIFSIVLGISIAPDLAVVNDVIDEWAIVSNIFVSVPTVVVGIADLIGMAVVVIFFVVTDGVVVSVFAISVMIDVFSGGFKYVVIDGIVAGVAAVSVMTEVFSVGFKHVVIGDIFVMFSVDDGIDLVLGAVVEITGKLAVSISVDIAGCVVSGVGIFALVNVLVIVLEVGANMMVTGIVDNVADAISLVCGIVVDVAITVVESVVADVVVLIGAVCVAVIIGTKLVVNLILDVVVGISVLSSEIFGYDAFIVVGVFKIVVVDIVGGIDACAFSDIDAVLISVFVVGVFVMIFIGVMLGIWIAVLAVFILCLEVSALDVVVYTASGVDCFVNGFIVTCGVVDGAAVLLVCVSIVVYLSLVMGDVWDIGNVALEAGIVNVNIVDVGGDGNFIVEVMTGVLADALYVCIDVMVYVVMAGFCIVLSGVVFDILSIPCDIMVESAGVIVGDVVVAVGDVDGSVTVDIFDVLAELGVCVGVRGDMENRITDVAVCAVESNPVVILVVIVVIDVGVDNDIVLVTGLDAIVDVSVCSEISSSILVDVVMVRLVIAIFRVKVTNAVVVGVGAVSDSVGNVLGDITGIIIIVVVVAGGKMVGVIVCSPVDCELVGFARVDGITILVVTVVGVETDVCIVEVIGDVHVVVSGGVMVVEVDDMGFGTDFVVDCIDTDALFSGNVIIVVTDIITGVGSGTVIGVACFDTEVAVSTGTVSDSAGVDEGTETERNNMKMLNI